MCRTGMVILLIAVLASACTLGTHVEPIEPASAVEISTSTPLPQTPVLATATVISTASAAGQSTDQGILAGPPATSVTKTANASPTQSNCTVKNDWLVYTVVSGDTLAAIAQRTASTVDELAAANCLANPNLVTVGQLLRVPTQPAPVSGSTQGVVEIHPALRTDGNWNVLRVGVEVVLGWSPAPPPQANRVDFLLAPTGTGVVPSVIGSDTNVSDGASIYWTPSSSLMGHLSAIAYLNDGTTLSTAQYTQVYAEEQAADGTIMIAPNTGFDGVTYTLERNALVIVTLNGAPLDVTQVEFYYYTEITQVPNMPNTTVLIGTDTNLSDGAQVEWHIPGGVEGRVNAVIHRTDGTTATSKDVRVFAVIY